MAAEDLIENVPVELVNSVDSILTLLKAFGILAIFYVIWLLIKGIFTFRVYRKIDKIYEDLKKIKRNLKIKN